jgi:hypothetical protein
MQRCRPAIEQGLLDRCPRRYVAGCMRSRGRRRGGVTAWMLDDVELRELRIFLAVLVARPGRNGPVQEYGAGCSLPWPAPPPADWSCQAVCRPKTCAPRCDNSATPGRSELRAAAGRGMSWCSSPSLRKARRETSLQRSMSTAPQARPKSRFSPPSTMPTEPGSAASSAARSARWSRRCPRFGHAVDPRTQGRCAPVLTGARVAMAPQQGWSGHGVYVPGDSLTGSRPAVMWPQIPRVRRDLQVPQVAK